MFSRSVSLRNTSSFYSLYYIRQRGKFWKWFIFFSYLLKLCCLIRMTKNLCMVYFSSYLFWWFAYIMNTNIPIFLCVLLGKFKRALKILEERVYGKMLVYFYQTFYIFKNTVKFIIYFVTWNSQEKLAWWM